MKRYIRAETDDDYYRVVLTRFGYVKYLRQGNDWYEGPIQAFDKRDAEKRIKWLENQDDEYERSVCDYSIEKIDKSELGNYDLYEIVEVVDNKPDRERVITYGTLEKCSEFLEDSWIHTDLHRECKVKNYIPGEILETYDTECRWTIKEFIRKVGE